MRKSPKSFAFRIPHLSENESGGSMSIVKEPVQISEDEYLNGGYQKIDEKDQVEINEEVNAIYKGCIAC